MELGEGGAAFFFHELSDSEIDGAVPEELNISPMPSEQIAENDNQKYWTLDVIRH